MKNFKWMYRLNRKALNVVASLALMTTVYAANRSCMWFFGQDKMPMNYKKLRRF